MPNKMREYDNFNVDEITRERDKNNQEDGKMKGLWVLMHEDFDPLEGRIRFNRKIDTGKWRGYFVESV